MKSLLIIASFVALAIASPTHRGIVADTAILDEPIAVDPTMVETHPISVGPAFVDPKPISVGPVIADFRPIVASPARFTHSGISFWQNYNVLKNIKGVVNVINRPIDIRPFSDAIVAESVNVMEAASELVQIVEVAATPIGTPILPMPVVPEVIPVAIGTPQLPTPVVLLELN